MTIIEDYLDRSPEQAKRIIGINIDQFQELVKKAEVIHHQKQQARPRLIQGGGGRRRKLSVQQEILLTLVYLNQFPTFLMLGIQFEVSESTAHDIFHYWVETLSEILPASLMEQVKKKESEREWIEEVLTDLELIVDSYQQPIQRPSDPKEEPKYYSKYKAGHTLKNQLIVTPNGREIVDGIVGYRGPTSDVKLWQSRQHKFSENQQFQGDTAYIGEPTISTPQKKPRLGKLTPEQKEDNRQKSKKRIRVEHLIRLVKIFRIASERFRLHAKSYPPIMALIYGLVRYRIGAFIFS
jgi:hypothetical protein